MVYKFRLQPKKRTFPAVTKLYKLSDNKDLVYELRPNSGLDLKKSGIEIKINSAGFRDKEYGLKTGNKKRIIFVGDSLTYGWALNLHETYHKQLEELFQAKNYNVDVLGMGVVGYNTVQEYYLIEEKALKFKPDIIILQICPNDFERTLGIKKKDKGEDYILIPYHDVSIPYVLGRGAISRFLMRNSHFYKFINLKIEQLIRKKNKDYSAKEYFLLGEEKAFRFLEKLKNLLDSEGVIFAAVIFPYRKIKGSYRYAALHEKIAGFLAKQHIPYIDLYDDFNTKGPPDIWTDNIHPNVKGNRIAAEKLFDFLSPLLQ